MAYRYGLMSAALALVALLPRPVGSTPRELLRDATFRRGFTVWADTPGKVTPVGTLQPPRSRATPVWTLSQWSSKYDIARATPQRAEGGGWTFADAAKAVTIGARGRGRADLVMSVDSRKEYGEAARKPNGPWVHFLAAQDIDESPRLADLDRLEFRVTARLARSTAYRTTDYSPLVHAAQFGVFLTVQNRKEHSPGFGQQIWFGIPIYDDRWRTPMAFTAPDNAGIFIYTPSGDAYTKESLHDGRWVTIRRDVVPLIREALETAWRRGFCPASHDLDDYRVTQLTIGWEVPGIFDVAMAVRDLGLTAVPRDR